MAHVRQTLREAVATLLRVTPTNWGSVLETRIATNRQLWPFVMVFASEESTVRDGIHMAGIYDRSVTINVVGMLKMPGTGDGTGNLETVEDRMDAMAAEIETKLTLTALQAAVAGASTLALQSTAMEVVLNEDDGTISHAEITMAWQITYETAEGSPEAFV